MPHPDITETSDGNPVFTEDMLGTLHRLTHQVDEMYKVLAALLDAYQRGGVIGTRTAAKRLRLKV